MYTIADIKSCGVQRRDGAKDFVMSLGNRSWRIVRDGNRWRFHGSLYPSLRIIKQLIVDAANLTNQANNGAAMSAAFRCIDPCALLIVNRVRLSEEVVRTLDCYGWLDGSGAPDWERAIRETRHYHRLMADPSPIVDHFPALLQMDA